MPETKQRKNKHTGKGKWDTCDICAFEYPVKELKKDNKGRTVCKYCYDDKSYRE